MLDLYYIYGKGKEREIINLLYTYIYNIPRLCELVELMKYCFMQEYKRNESNRRGLLNDKTN